MRRLLIVFSLFPTLLLSQELEHTLLWRISSDGAASSYLYGTMHSKDDRAFQFGDSVLAAMDRCRIVAGELDLNTDQQGIALIKRMWMPDGKELKDLYKKKDWTRVDQALKGRLGMAAPLLYRVKPMFVVAMLTEATMEGDRPNVLDEYLQIRGRENGQRVIGIETIDEQLSAMDVISLKEQAAMLLDHIDHEGYPEEMETMLDRYAAQDLQGLLKAAETSGGMSAEMEKSLLTDRNARMVHRMDSLLRTGESAFFLIGAAHLPNADGLIAGLRAKGYAVEAVMSAARKPEDPEPDR